MKTKNETIKMNSTTPVVTPATSPSNATIKSRVVNANRRMPLEMPSEASQDQIADQRVVPNQKIPPIVKMTIHIAISPPIQSLLRLNHL